MGKFLLEPAEKIYHIQRIQLFVCARSVQNWCVRVCVRVYETKITHNKTVYLYGYVITAHSGRSNTEISFVASHFYLFLFLSFFESSIHVCVFMQHSCTDNVLHLANNMDVCMHTPPHSHHTRAHSPSPPKKQKKRKGRTMKSALYLAAVVAGTVARVMPTPTASEGGTRLLDALEFFDDGASGLSQADEYGQWQLSPNHFPSFLLARRY